MFTVTLYNRLTPWAPLSGQAPGASWLGGVVYNAATGATATPPAIVELGSTGKYEVNLPAAFCGFISFGGNCTTPEVFVPDSAGLTFPIFGANGAPNANVSPSALSWECCYDTATNTPIVSPPGFAALGSGIYKYTAALVSTAAGTINLTAPNLPQYWDLDQPSVRGIPPPGTGPTVTLSPQPGPTLPSTQPITITITPGSNPLATVSVTCYFGPAVETAYDDSAIQPMYQAASTMTGSYGSGLVFTLIRNGGWPYINGAFQAPGIKVIATDTAGNVNQ